MDTECKAAAAAAPACEITDLTRSFGLQMANGMVLKFDERGSAKARAALQNGPKQPGPVTVTARGAVQGGILIVESIEIPQV